jgi:hypothetical protein
MGARAKEMSSLSLTKYTDTNSYIEISKNQIIKIREKFRILEYILISLLRSLFFINYIIVILGYCLVWSVSSFFCFDPLLFYLLIQIIRSENIHISPEKIHPYFITGFSDAEATFTISVTKDNRERKTTKRIDSNRIIYGVHPSFAISLNIKDRNLIYSLQSYFAVGKIKNDFKNNAIAGNSPSAKRYYNVEADKAIIIKDNQGKSGIYMFKNLTNGKRYIGSSENIIIRFLQYFNFNYLLSHKCMAICCALLKHGYPNFSLEILEYCEPEKCLIREKHYWDLLNPPPPSL